MFHTLPAFSQTPGGGIGRAAVTQQGLYAAAAADYKARVDGVSLVAPTAMLGATLACKASVSLGACVGVGAVALSVYAAWKWQPEVARNERIARNYRVLAAWPHSDSMNTRLLEYARGDQTLFDAELASESSKRTVPSRQ